MYGQPVGQSLRETPSEKGDKCFLLTVPSLGGVFIHLKLCIFTSCLELGSAPF